MRGATEHAPVPEPLLLVSVATSALAVFPCRSLRCPAALQSKLLPPRAFPERCAMHSEPLEDLSEQSARVGSWVPSVATAPRSEEYKWTKGTACGAGKKFECLLVSQDSTQYCVGLYRKKGKAPAATKEFTAASSRFKKGTIWKVNKITLAKTEPTFL